MCQPPLTHNRQYLYPKRRTPRTAPQCASHHSHIADSPTLPKHNNRGKQPLPRPRHRTSTPPTPQCASHHSHISPDPNATPLKRQPALTHNCPKPASKASSTPHRPQCASRPSHIAKQRTLPTHNNRGKQPLPQTRHQPHTPSTPQCDSHHSHIGPDPNATPT